jgi:hypothetical protein
VTIQSLNIEDGPVSWERMLYLLQEMIQIGKNWQPGRKGLMAAAVGNSAHQP